MNANPFKPSAGSSPPLLIGRQPAIDVVADGLADGPGAPGRMTIFTGARGVGKTVMLNEVESVALSAGWLYISETATDGLVGRLEGHVEHLTEQSRPRSRRRVTDVTLPFRLGGVKTELTPELAIDLRRKTTDLLQHVGPDSGLLITIDEVHGGAIAEMQQVGALAQHLIREDRQFAIVMAGLPSAVSALLSDRVLTFLRRAERLPLRDVPIDEVRDALIDTITDNGRTIDDDASLMAADATGGYPFLIQLVGYHLWRNANGDRIDEEAARAGVSAARRRLGSLVHETALRDLSNVDRTFLLAMSVDDGPSQMGDILKRMGVGPQYGNTYKGRAIDAGMIESVAYGKVDFAIPYLREYLREHAASLGIAAAD